jgi:hypothetical protein
VAKIALLFERVVSTVAASITPSDENARKNANRDQTSASRGNGDAKLNWSMGKLVRTRV